MGNHSVTQTAKSIACSIRKLTVYGQPRNDTSSDTVRTKRITCCKSEDRYLDNQQTYDKQQGTVKISLTRS